MPSVPFPPPQLKVAMIVFGVGLGLLDVKEARESLEHALEARTTRTIGARMFIADPFFVAKAWRLHLSACGGDVWCRLPAPITYDAPVRKAPVRPDLGLMTCSDSAMRTIPPALDSATRAREVSARISACTAASLRLRTTSSAPREAAHDTMGDAASDAGLRAGLTRLQAEPERAQWWSRAWPVVVARMAVFPIVQSGWTLFQRGWTARVVFTISILIALLVASKAGEGSTSFPGTVLLGVASFLAVSIVVSFSFNLLLKAGNLVAGYWGVLFALATGIYVSLELMGKIREFVHVTGIGRHR